MFKKNLLLLCALTAAYAPVAKAEDVDVKGKCKKCCNCASLNVSGGGTIAGALSVGSLTSSGAITAGSTVSATSFVTPSGALFNGLRNYAVFSNQAPVLNGTEVPFDEPSTFNSSAITDNGSGNITLPVGGIFLVMYTVRVAVAASSTGTATVQLQQGNGTTFAAITQPAVINTTDTLPAATAIQVQVSGYALVATTSTSNNQINLEVSLSSGGLTVPAVGGTDANAQLTILQLN